MIEALTLPFMQRALLAAVLSGLIAPAIGTFIVQRRMSLLGDGLGHVAIMGVGLALMTGWAPLPVAVVTCVAGAVVVELLRQHGKASGDLGLAIWLLDGPRHPPVLLDGTTSVPGRGRIRTRLAGLPIYSAQPQLPPALIGASSRIENSFIAAGARIHGEVVHSVVGPRAVVEQGTVLRDTVVLDGAHIGAGVELTNCIVDIGATVTRAGSRGSHDHITVIGVDGLVSERQKLDPKYRLPSRGSHRSTRVGT